MRTPPRIPRFVVEHKPKPRTPIREAHLAFIRQLPCICCGRTPAGEAAHVRESRAEFGKFNAMGKKPDGKFTLPLCHQCHVGDQHTKYGEPEFWARLGIDATIYSNRLWAVTGNLEEGRRTIFRAHQAIALHRAPVTRVTPTGGTS